MAQNKKEVPEERVVAQYLESVEAAQNEAAISFCFKTLLNKLFRRQPGVIADFIPGIEKYVPRKEEGRIKRGWIDLLYGDLIIEFESNLQRKQEEAEKQLREYAAGLWSQEPVGKRRSYRGLATDGVNCRVYRFKNKKPEKQEVAPNDVRLELMKEESLLKLGPAKACSWLEEALRPGELRSPTTKSIVIGFGLESQTFKDTRPILLSRWKEIKDQSQFQVIYESWDGYLLIVYGSSVANEKLFIRHTYLSMLAKLMACSKSRADLSIRKLLASLDPRRGLALTSRDVEPRLKPISALAL